jgi:transcriptional regulator with XRE-family HTH domain
MPHHSRDFGRRLKAEREARGISREELARRAQVSPDTIQFVEQGRRNVSLQVFVLLLDQFPELTADQLLGRGAEDCQRSAS